MAEQTKKKRGRPPLSEEEKQQRAITKKENPLKPVRVLESTNPGDNSKFLRHALTTMGMPPIDISDPAQVQERLWWYFNHCAEDDMKPTVNGMCNALGIHRDTLHTWRTGEFRSGTHQEIIVKAYKLLEELWEDYMLNGKINPVSGIFIAKNLFYGYFDKQELVLTPNAQTEAVDPNVIAQKYAELPDDEYPTS